MSKHQRMLLHSLELKPNNEFLKKINNSIIKEVLKITERRKIIERFLSLFFRAM